MIPIDPVGLSMKSWCDQMLTALSQYGIRRVLMSEDDWPSWAMYVYPILQKYKGQTPDPRGMGWREWARRVNGVLAS